MTAPKMASIAVLTVIGGLVVTALLASGPYMAYRYAVDKVVVPQEQLAAEQQRRKQIEAAILDLVQAPTDSALVAGFRAIFRSPSVR